MTKTMPAGDTTHQEENQFQEPEAEGMLKVSTNKFLDVPAWLKRVFFNLVKRSRGDIFGSTRSRDGECCFVVQQNTIIPACESEVVFSIKVRSSSKEETFRLAAMRSQSFSEHNFCHRFFIIGRSALLSIFWSTLSTIR